MIVDDMKRATEYKTREVAEDAIRHWTTERRKFDLHENRLNGKWILRAWLSDNDELSGDPTFLGYWREE